MTDFDLRKELRTLVDTLEIVETWQLRSRIADLLEQDHLFESRNKPHVKETLTVQVTDVTMDQNTFEKKVEMAITFLEQHLEVVCKGNSPRTIEVTTK